MHSAHNQAAVFIVALLASFVVHAASNPVAQPIELEGAYEDAVVKDNYLFLSTRDAEIGKSDIDIFLRSPNGTFEKIAGYFTKDSAHSMAISGITLYLASGFGIEVIDLSQPGKPRLLNTLTFDGYTHKVLIKERYAYVATGFAGLQVLDISAPTQPKPVASFVAYPAPTAEDLSPDGNIDDGESIFSEESSSSSDKSYFSADDLPIGEDDEPSMTLEQLGKTEGALDLAIEGNSLFLSYGSAGLIILDISNPLHPVKVTEIASDYPTEHTTVDDNLLFTTNGVSGIATYDISLLNAPEEISRQHTPCYPQDITAVLGKLYVADGFCGGNGLQIFTINDDKRLTLKQREKGLIGGVRVENGYLYAFGLKKTHIFRLESLTK